MAAFIYTLLICCGLSLLQWKFGNDKRPGLIALAASLLVLIYVLCASRDFPSDSPLLFCGSVLFCWALFYAGTWVVFWIKRWYDSLPDSPAPAPSAPTEVCSENAPSADSPAVATPPAADAVPAPAAERFFTTARLKKFAVTVLPFVLLIALQIYQNRPPLSDYSCPEFYFLSFGMSEKQVMRKVESLGGPEPTYHLITTTGVGSNTLDYEPETLMVAGVPVRAATCTFNSVRGRLNDIELTFDRVGSNWERLSAYYLENYKTSTPSSDTHYYWDHYEYAITVDLKDAAIVVDYYWTSNEEWNRIMRSGPPEIPTPGLTSGGSSVQSSSQPT